MNPDHPQSHITLPKINAQNLEQLIYDSTPKKLEGDHTPSMAGQSKISTTSTILSKLQNRIADFKHKEIKDKHHIRNASTLIP